MATFSVIIPIYNIEKYIRQCLDSVVSQTFSDLEIILVDDGSTDNCPTICDEYAAYDARVRVIHKENGGLVSARKTGAREACADYIACVDGDDWIEKDYFEKFYSIIEKFSPDVICCGAIMQSKNGDRVLKTIAEQPGLYTKADIEEKIYPHIIGFSNNIWGKVFKRDLYLKVQLSVDEQIKMAEDACVVVPCVYKAESMYIIEDCLYDYRYNPSSMTKNKSVYNLEEPKQIANHFVMHMDLRCANFAEQIYNSTVHRLFNRCVSQFYTMKSYKEVCKKLNQCLDDDFYQECIVNSHYSFSKSPKEWFARHALIRRDYFWMKLYSKIR